MFKGFGEGRLKARASVIAAAAGAALAYAAPAAADTVLVYSADFFDPQVAQTDIPGREIALDSPFVIHGRDMTTDMQFTTLAFCIDFFTDMAMEDAAGLADGVNDINLDYQDGPVPGVSDADRDKIFRLVDYGTKIYQFHQSAPTTGVRLAAIQAAIWQIQTGHTFTFYHDDDYSVPGGDQMIHDFVNLVGVGPVRTNREVRALLSDDGSAQGLAYSVRAAVPEPATWGLLIGGFFVVGGAMRRVRRTAAQAA